MLGASSIGLGLFALLVRKIIKDESWYARFNHKVETLFRYDGHLTTAFVLSLAGFLGGSFFLYTAITTTNLFVQGYFVRLAPGMFWFTALCGQVIFFSASQDSARLKQYIYTHGIALITLAAILVVGLVIHDYFWELPIETWDTHKLFNQDDKFDLVQQDIVFVFNEGDNLQHGRNPYASAVALGDNLQWNQGNATYLPVFYILSWLSQEIGLEDFLQWLGFWRVIFLIFNLSIAYLLFYIPYHRYGSLALACFAALFWLFNRWTLHMTMIYHIDFVAIFFFLVSLITWPQRKKLALLAFGLSLSVKQIAIFMIPLYLIWIWQATEKPKIKQFIILSVIMGSIPLLVSGPFLAWNAEGFIKSIFISATRNSESHFGIPSIDTLIGLTGIPAKIPMLLLMFVTFYLAWKRKINQFMAALFIMIVFVDFNSVLFRQYLTWVVPLIPLAVGDTLAKSQAPPSNSAQLLPTN